jgi:hypothetical protein
VRRTREEYGILDEDTYNVDQTGFAMGIAATLGASKVATTLPIVSRATSIQPRDRELVTTTECVNASGFTNPPFTILRDRIDRTHSKRVPPPVYLVPDA